MVETIFLVSVCVTVSVKCRHIKKKNQKRKAHTKTQTKQKILVNHHQQYIDMKYPKLHYNQNAMDYQTQK